jgi:hypothetical protein
MIFHFNLSNCGKIHDIHPVVMNSGGIEQVNVSLTGNSGLLPKGGTFPVFHHVTVTEIHDLPVYPFSSDTAFPLFLGSFFRFGDGAVFNTPRTDCFFSESEQAQGKMGLFSAAERAAYSPDDPSGESFC